MNLVTSRPDTQAVVLKPRFPPPSTAEVVSSDFYKILHSLVGGRQCTDDTYSGMPYEGACVYIIISVHVCLYSAHGHVCVACAYAYMCSVYMCTYVCMCVRSWHSHTISHYIAWQGLVLTPQFFKIITAVLLLYCK